MYWREELWENIGALQKKANNLQYSIKKWQIETKWTVFKTIDFDSLKNPYFEEFRKNFDNYLVW